MQKIKHLVNLIISCFKYSGAYAALEASLKYKVIPSARSQVTLLVQRISDFSRANPLGNIGNRIFKMSSVRLDEK